MHIESLTELGWKHFFQSQLTLDSYETELAFRVTAVQRNLIECLGFDQSGDLQNPQISTYFWREELPEAHPTVGDWLMLDYDLSPLRLLERNTLIKRRSAGRESTIQLIAANIDTLFIVTSCNEEFSLNRIERYLALAAESHIDAVVVMTKKDLCDDTTIFTDPLRTDYPDLAIEIINATKNAELDVLSGWCGSGNTVALVGSSGVGKSTIVNSLKGAVEQATGAIRETDSKGRHTTTSRSLHQLAGKAILIDTPGMRELQIVDCEEGIQSTFADIDELAKVCRFGDCQHNTEPGCAVRREIECGKLDQRRLDNYQKLLSEQQRNTQSVAQRHSSDRALGKFYKQTLQGSRRFKSRD